MTALMGQVLQTGLEVELADHLGYEAYDPAGRGSGNNRNGSYPKTVNTEIGQVEVRMPRDRAGTFEPVTAPSMFADWTACRAMSSAFTPRG